MSETGNQETNSQEIEIEIPEVEEANETDGNLEIEGLMDSELVLAREHGLMQNEEEGIEKKGEEDVEHKEQSSTKTEEDSGEPKKEEKKEVENPTFEQVEKDEKLVDKYDKNAKALYWKWKTDKHKRQEAQKELKELKEKLDEVKDYSGSKNKLEKISKLIDDYNKNPDTSNLTVESLQAIISEQAEKDLKEENTAVQPDVIKQKVATKSMFAEKIGLAKYDNFQEIAQLAGELSQENATYQNIIDNAFVDDSIDENMLVETIVSIAKLSPKYADLGKEVEVKEKNTTDRVINNSKKKISSASVTSGGASTVVTESNLTVDQAMKLSPERFSKLSPKTQKRILMGIDP